MRIVPSIIEAELCMYVPVNYITSGLNNGMSAISRQAIIEINDEIF